ncbi:MAG: nitroreductase family protein [Deltaproteobacteria bacterium]|nr:nitroreductase family protein [Deltaproteobacteria bacterium]
MDKDQFLSILRGRRSIRRYEPDDVPDELLHLIMEAGRWAPSGDNNQPGRFIVIKDPEIKKKMGEIAKEGSARRVAAEFFTGRMQERFARLEDPLKKEKAFRKLTSGEVSAFLADAPVIIVVCAKLDVWDVPYDTAMCAQNMMLMAHVLGLSTCCVVAPVSDMRDDVKIMELLKIPHGYKVALPLTVGYPDESPNPRPRIPLEDIIFHEAFGKRRE